MEKFSISINGYNKVEVNKFVSDVTSEYENMLLRLKESDKEISLLKEQLKQYKNLESTLNKALLVAEDSSNQIKNIAKDEAKLIIETAKKNASVIVNDALLKAEKTEIETDTLRRSLKIYKSRVKEIIEEQLTMINDMENTELERRDD